MESEQLAARQRADAEAVRTAGSIEALAAMLRGMEQRVASGYDTQGALDASRAAEHRARLVADEEAAAAQRRTAEAIEASRAAAEREGERTREARAADLARAQAREEARESEERWRKSNERQEQLLKTIEAMESKAEVVRQGDQRAREEAANAVSEKVEAAVAAGVAKEKAAREEELRQAKVTLSATKAKAEGVFQREREEKEKEWRAAPWPQTSEELAELAGTTLRGRHDQGSAGWEAASAEQRRMWSAMAAQERTCLDNLRMARARREEDQGHSASAAGAPAFGGYTGRVDQATASAARRMGSAPDPGSTVGVSEFMDRLASEGRGAADVAWAGSSRGVPAKEAMAMMSDHSEVHMRQGARRSTAHHDGNDLSEELRRRRDLAQGGGRVELEHISMKGGQARGGRAQSDGMEGRGAGPGSFSMGAMNGTGWAQGGSGASSIDGFAATGGGHGFRGGGDLGSSGIASEHQRVQAPLMPEYARGASFMEQQGASSTVGGTAEALGLSRSSSSKEIMRVFAESAMLGRGGGATGAHAMAAMAGGLQRKLAIFGPTKTVKRDEILFPELFCGSTDLITRYKTDVTRRKNKGLTLGKKGELQYAADEGATGKIKDKEGLFTAVERLGTYAEASGRWTTEEKVEHWRYVIHRLLPLCDEYAMAAVVDWDYAMRILVFFGTSTWMQVNSDTDAKYLPINHSKKIKAQMEALVAAMPAARAARSVERTTTTTLCKSPDGIVLKNTKTRSGTKICLAFQDGPTRCKYGDACTRAHVCHVCLKQTCVCSASSARPQQVPAAKEPSAVA
jgi:chemotaxis protein histidine kinase CheA